jgi:hypothetical protein
MRRLRQAAGEEKRSLNAQASYWLEASASRWRSRAERDQLFESIQATREAIYRKHGMGSDSTKIIRRMRDERTAHLASLHTKAGRAKTRA